MRETLIFGPALPGGAPLDPTAAVAALPDEAEICGCNGVCKGKITGAIDDARARRRSTTCARTPRRRPRCGSCTGLVEQLLKVTLGDAYNPAAVQPMCKCTDHGHDDVRRLIVAKALKSIPDADAGARVEDLVRLREVPAGAELLPARDVARRIRTTTASRASSTSASTPTSRRTAPTRSCRACGAA